MNTFLAHISYLTFVKHFPCCVFLDLPAYSYMLFSYLSKWSVVIALGTENLKFGYK